jgi:hypothetical protein
MEYKANQNDLKIKKINDDELRKKREVLEKELESKIHEVEFERNKIQ